MSNETDSIYSAFLSQLDKFEENPQAVTPKKIEAWKNKVAKTLDGSYKTRFKKLTFQIKESTGAPPIPF